MEHILALTALEGSESEGHEAFPTVCHKLNRHCLGRLFVFREHFFSQIWVLEKQRQLAGGRSIDRGTFYGTVKDTSR